VKKKIFSQKEGLSREHRSFKKMHARVKEGRVKYCHWTYDATGFEEFIACVGRIPEDMKRPSIGRFDHNDGYRLENCAWQELSENIAEPWSRNDERTKRRKELLSERIKKNNPAKAAWDRGAYKNRKKRGPFKRRSPTAETLKLMSIGMKISSMKRNSKLEFNGILGFGC
jgi:hypothetical protein